MCPGGDIHASDAGYAMIGGLMFEAAGYTRFELGTTPSTTTPASGC